jgi:hypothetical protein
MGIQIGRARREVFVEDAEDEYTREVPVWHDRTEPSRYLLWLILCPQLQPRYAAPACRPGRMGVFLQATAWLKALAPAEAASAGPALKRARLSESREWFVQAPVEIELNNGVVTSASLELPNIVLGEDVIGSLEASE